MAQIIPNIFDWNQSSLADAKWNKMQFLFHFVSMLWGFIKMKKVYFILRW